MKKTPKKKLIAVSKDLRYWEAHKFLVHTKDLFPDGRLVRSRRVFDNCGGKKYPMYFVARAV